MSKKKSGKNKQYTETQQHGITIPETFDYQRFADAIVNAQFKAGEKEKEITEQENQKADAEWKRLLGYKEYDSDKKWPIRIFYELRNDIVLLYHILFFKRENAKYDIATFALLTLSLCAVFALLKVVLYLTTIAFLALVFYSAAKGNFPHGFVSLCFALLSFMIARLVRMAQFEIENMKERGLLIGILSAVTSFVAMVVALLAFLK